MEREEIIDFLRENLDISISLDRLSEYGSEYITCNITLRLGEDIISDSHESVYIS